MSKKELDKKRDELANKIFLKPNNTMEDDFKAGFDSAVNLLLPRLEEAEKREIHLENSVERLFNLISDLHIIPNGIYHDAIEIYNEAEIVVRDEKKNE